MHEHPLASHPSFVLSGSHAASGKPSQDGILGLPRSLLAAGARSVLGCLCDAVDDSTGALITKYHMALAEEAARGSTRGHARALQAAMLAVRDAEGGKWAHPLFWAGFVLTGAAV